VASRQKGAVTRALRLESENGVYHVLNRGNYRAAIFEHDRTKQAFLKCLDEVCGKTGWQVHAWCIMSNHYHLAISTPRANLVAGMRWLQCTFALRFNSFRGERGHLFQGRYKSLAVDPDEGLGPLCHYIHLNPVRARLCAVDGLRRYRWASLCWLLNPRLRPVWYEPMPALRHAGDLVDRAADHVRYLTYLNWLAEDEPARKAQQFDRMAKGWAIGSKAFIQSLTHEQCDLRGQGRRLACQMTETLEALWRDELEQLLCAQRRTPEDLVAAGKSADWKLALAATLKSRTTVTNRWLAINLSLGNLHETSRKVSAWRRQAEVRTG
jgi:putative transposase